MGFNWRRRGLVAAGSWAIGAVVIVGCGAAADETAARQPPAAQSAPHTAIGPAVVRQVPTQPPDPDPTAAELFARTAPTAAELASLAARIEATPEVDVFAQRFAASADAARAAARLLTDRLDRVIALRSPRWTIAAYVQQAQIYEALARGMTDALTTPNLPHFVMRDRAGQALTMTPDVEAALQSRLRASARALIEPIECLALLRYTLAVQASRSASIESPEAIVAVERLGGYAESTRTRCSQ